MIKKFKAFILKIKLLFKLVDRHESDIDILKVKLENLEKFVKDAMTVHCDVHMRGDPHQVIVVGRYKKRDLVRIYSIQEDDFFHFVETLSRMEKGARIGRFDTPYGWPGVKAVLDTENF